MTASDPPGVTTPVIKPLRISWTRLRTHDECPAKGHLVSAGHKSPVTDTRNFFPGTVCDRAMRQWLSLEHPERGWMAAHVNRIMDEEEKTGRETGDGIVKWKHDSDRAEVRAMCIEAVTRLESDLWSRLRIGQPDECDWDPALRFEVPIMVPHPAGHKEKVSLVGEMDLLVQEPSMLQASSKDNAAAPGALEVLDLKATRDNQYWRKTLGQLVFYEIAVWCMKGQWPFRSGLLQPLCDHTTPSWEFTMEHRTQMMQRIVKLCEDIWADRLPPKPETGKCGYCEVRHACPLKGTGRGRTGLLAVSGA